jgi:hypothetical protein
MMSKFWGYIMKSRKKLAKLSLLLLVMLFLAEWAFAPGGFKNVYYNFFGYDAGKVRVAVDPNFNFFEEGYTKSLKLNSKYYISHRILLIPNSKTVPVDYEFKGEIFIECCDKNGKNLHSFTVKKPEKVLRKGKEDYFGNYLVYVSRYNPSNASSLFAFELGEIPFELFCMKWNRLKEMQIRITVIKADEQLKSFCDSAELIVIPDLRM